MKLRIDLLKHATPDEVVREALAQNPRYKPEPRFSKTGTGSLSSASIEQCANEVTRSTERIRKAMKQSGASGKRNEPGA